jgi:hypothetical protein
VNYLKKIVDEKFFILDFTTLFQMIHFALKQDEQMFSMPLAYLD